MGSVKENILAACAVREKQVVVEGQSLTVREVGALEFAEYGKLNKTDRVTAVGYLLSVCVLDGPSGQPLLSKDEAKQLAGSARVSMPLMAAIMELSGFGDGAVIEKEADAS